MHRLFLLLFFNLLIGQSFYPKIYSQVTSGTNISNYSCFKKHFWDSLYNGDESGLISRVEILRDQGKGKVVVVIDPSYHPNLDIRKLDEMNNIGILYECCQLPIPKYKKLAKFFGAADAFFVSDVCCHLITDNGQSITIYVVEPYGFYDYSRYGMNHSSIVAMILDSDGNILHILDNVNNEQDILKEL